MHPARALGGLVTVAAVVGYAVGVSAAYPGRAFTLTALMIGITLVAVGGEVE